MVTRMATLADGGRITVELVDEEVERIRSAGAEAAPHGICGGHDASAHVDLSALLGKDFRERYDEFDLVQLRHVVAVCRGSASAADAARRLYAVSMQAKKSSNNSDRLSKYLARFGLKFKDLREGSHV